MRFNAPPCRALNYNSTEPYMLVLSTYGTAEGQPSVHTSPHDDHRVLLHTLLEPREPPIHHNPPLSPLCPRVGVSPRAILLVAAMLV